MESDLKYYSSKEIHLEYLNFSLEERNKILYDAIDVMNQYNVRTRFLCIAMAMGYRNDEGLDSYYYKT